MLFRRVYFEPFGRSFSKSYLQMQLWENCLPCLAHVQTYRLQAQTLKTRGKSRQTRVTIDYTEIHLHNPENSYSSGRPKDTELSEAPFYWV